MKKQELISLDDQIKTIEFVLSCLKAFRNAETPLRIQISRAMWIINSKKLDTLQLSELSSLLDLYASKYMAQLSEFESLRSLLISINPLAEFYVMSESEFICYRIKFLEGHDEY